MMAAFKDYWTGLEAREQRLIKLGLPVIVLLALYLLVWEPLKEGRQEAATQEAGQEQTLAYLQSLKGDLRPVQELNARRWQALAQSQGWRQVEAQETAGLWQLSGRVNNPVAVERFLQAAAEQGWHWQAVEMQGNPLQVNLELRPL